MKETILNEVEAESKELMSKLYDLIASGKNTHEEFMVFTKILETSSRLTVLENQLARYESYLK